MNSKPLLAQSNENSTPKFNKLTVKCDENATVDILSLNSVKYSDIENYDYAGICVGIGGIKGIILAGAVHEFWERSQLKNLSYYAGSSAGSMIVSLLSIGYSPVDTLTMLCAPDFANNFDSMNFMNLSSIFGLYPNSIIRNKLEQMFKLKLGYLPTFLDIYKKLHKIVIIPVYCLSEQDDDRKQYCSYKTTPDMQIIDAIILSSSVPILFEKAEYQDKVYIDGAYTSMCPIDALQEMVPEGTKILGLCLKPSSVNFKSFLNYAMRIMSIPLDVQRNFDNLLPNTYVIQLCSDSDTTSFNFKLTTTEKMNMFSSGTKQIQLLSKIKEI
jgi:predicted acylesterase/phospholipase RssA